MSNFQIAISGVSAGQYGNTKQIPTFKVDARGRITWAADVEIETTLNVKVNDTQGFPLNLLTEAIALNSGPGINMSADAENKTINISASTDGLVLLDSGSQEILGNITLKSLTSTAVSTPVATIGLMSFDKSRITTIHHRLDIGDTEQPVSLVINSSSKNDGLEIYSAIDDSPLRGPSISVIAARGTLSAPRALELGDSSGSIKFSGLVQTSEGLSYEKLAMINSVVSKIDGLGAVSTLEFMSVGTGPHLSQLTTSELIELGKKSKATFDHRGVFASPILKPGAHSVMPENPEEGWIVFDTSSKQFKGWTGSAWVTLG